MTTPDHDGPVPADGPPRVDVLGVGVSCLTLDSAVEEVSGWVDRGEHKYVRVTGLHGVMECPRDPQLLRIHNRSGLTTLVGMPMVWSAHWAGRREVRRVYSSDLMAAVLARAVDRGWSSFFYGGGPGTATTLLSFQIWKESFSMYDFGAGSAVAFIVVAISAVMILAITRALPSDLFESD